MHDDSGVVLLVEPSLCRRALVHNLKFDEGVAVFANAAGAGARNSLLLSTAAALAPSSGECTAISFRTGAYLR